MKKLIYILPLLFFTKITLAQDKQAGTLQTWKVQGGGGGNGTVKSVSKTDGYGYSSTITNPTTTPNITGSVDTVVIPSKPFLSNELAKKRDTSYHTNFYAESPLSVRDTLVIEGADTIHGVISSLDNLNMPELSYKEASRDTTNWRANNTLVDEQFLTDRISSSPISSAVEAALGLKFNLSDTSAAFSPYARKNKVQFDSSVLATAINLRALDANVVHTTGTETVAGTKTFNNSFQVNSSTNVYWGNNAGPVAGYGVLSWDGALGKAIIGSIAGKTLELLVNGNPGITFDLSGNATVRGVVKPKAASDSAASPQMMQVYPSNKKWVIFGDSFSSSTAGGYPLSVINKVKFSGTVTNAVSGNKISQQIHILDSILTATPTYFNSFDICSILIGVNDFAASTALGTYSDDSTATTFVGYLRHFITSVLVAKPTIALYVMTPPEANGAGVYYRATNSAGWTLSQMALLIKRVCADYSVSCIDLYNTSQRNLFTMSSLTSDGLHPNTAGANIIANSIVSAFSNQYSNVYLSPIDAAATYAPLSTTPTISSGSGAPSSTPAKVGDEYLDLTNKKDYKAFGTTSSADWILLN